MYSAVCLIHVSQRGKMVFCPYANSGDTDKPAHSHLANSVEPDQTGRKDIAIVKGPFPRVEANAPAGFLCTPAKDLSVQFNDIDCTNTYNQ